MQPAILRLKVQPLNRRQPAIQMLLLPIHLHHHLPLPQQTIPRRRPHHQQLPHKSQRKPQPLAYPVRYPISITNMVSFCQAIPHVPPV